MKLIFHDSFKKVYLKRIVNDAKLRDKTQQRIDIFRHDRKNPLLKDHALTGSKLHYRSFWVTGDIRIIYEQKDDETIVFLDIGSHAQVY